MWKYVGHFHRPGYASSSPCQFQRDLLSDLTFRHNKGRIRMNSLNSFLMSLSQLYPGFAGVCFASTEVRLSKYWSALPHLTPQSNRQNFFLPEGYKNVHPSSSLTATADCHRMSHQLSLTNNKAQRKSLFPTPDSLLSSAFFIPNLQ